MHNAPEVKMSSASFSGWIRLMKKLRPYREGILWFVILWVMAFSPLPSDGHFSFCILHSAGFSYCPGCGIGRSMILALHGEFLASLQMHPAGILAVVLFILRIIVIFNPKQKNLEL